MCYKKENTIHLYIKFYAMEHLELMCVKLVQRVCTMYIFIVVLHLHRVNIPLINILQTITESVSE